MFRKIAGFVLLGWFPALVLARLLYMVVIAIGYQKLGLVVMMSLAIVLSSMVGVYLLDGKKDV